MLVETITADEVKNFSDYSPIEQRLISAQHPEETNYYKPISYKRMIDETMNELEKRNFNVTSRRYVVTKNCSTAIAFYSIKGDNAQFGQQLGWRNSYDKTMSVAIVTGLNVWICGNGMISGEIGFVKRHVGMISTELQDAIESQIDVMSDKYVKMVSQLEALQSIPLTRRQMSELAGRLYIDEELILPYELGKLKSEILKPSFDYEYDGYKYNNEDAYSFYQHLTYVMKTVHPVNNPERLLKIHNFFEDNFIKG